MSRSRREIRFQPGQLLIGLVAITSCNFFASSWSAGQENPQGKPGVGLADHFDNGRPADSDAVKDAWNVIFKPLSSVVEADGKVTMTATGAEWPEVGMVATARPDFDFLRRPVRMVVDGVEFSGEKTNPDQQIVRFAFLPSPTDMLYLAETALVVSLRGDGLVQLGYKVDQPGTDKHDAENVNTLVRTQNNNAATGFTLDLNADVYTLVVRFGKEQSETYTGHLSDKGPGLKPAQWTESGPALRLQVQKRRGDNDAKSTVSIGEITVSSSAVSSK